MSIAKKLKELREQKGLNKKQTALNLKMPYTTYCNYESGLREPNADTLKQVAKYYNTTVDYIIGMKIGDKSYFNYLCTEPKIKKLIMEFNALSEAGQDAVLDFLKYQLYAEQGFFDEERFYHDVQEIVDDRM